MTRILLLIPIIAAMCPAQTCRPLTGDRITAQEMAGVIPAFGQLPSELNLGFAAPPGIKRVFLPAELQRLAHANGLVLSNPPSACFEIAMRVLSADEVLTVMRGSLPAGIAITVAEVQKSEVPAGQLEFPMSGLEPSSGAMNSQLWRGFVRYAASKRSPVWARVVLSQNLEVVVATKDLPAGAAIAAGSLTLRRWTGPVLRGKAADRIQDVVGRAPRKPLKSGEPVLTAELDQPEAVRRGDEINVEVRSGTARLVFRAVAERAARDGELVDLRNPSSGRIFRARVEGSKAVIAISGGVDQ